MLKEALLSCVNCSVLLPSMTCSMLLPFLLLPGLESAFAAMVNVAKNFCSKYSVLMWKMSRCPCCAALRWGGSFSTCQ